ncbi:MAG: hypothetical protein JXK05_04585 [Campylobacterales bacterium]|nr:hypothetical protein [Campylobacterales bacterium]
MNSSLYIVRSPLQLLNAIEAKHHFKTQRNILVVLYNKNSNATDLNNIQLTQLLEVDSWDEIIEYNKGERKSAGGLRAQVRIIKKLRQEHFDFLFSGDYAVLHQIMIANIPCKSLYLLDDGTLTLTIYKNGLDPNYKERGFARRFKLFRYRLFNLKTDHDKPVNFFTCFHLDPVEGKTIVFNHYDFLKTRFLPHTIRDDETLYFLGSSLLNTGKITEETYIRTLRACIDYFDRPMVYIPHRAEIVGDALKALQSDRFRLDASTGPIELRFLLERRYPMHIASFFSTALYTLNHIFPESAIVSIRFKDEEILGKRDIIQNKYDFFDTTTVKVITL